MCESWICKLIPASIPTLPFTTYNQSYWLTFNSAQTALMPFSYMNSAQCHFNQVTTSWTFTDPARREGHHQLQSCYRCWEYHVVGHAGCRAHFHFHLLAMKCYMHFLHQVKSAQFVIAWVLDQGAGRFRISSSPIKSNLIASDSVG